MARCPTCHRRLASGRGCPQHGGPPAPVEAAPADDGPPPVWREPIGRCIGRGGFASVWDIPSSGHVLKVAHADHDLARARMRREAEALAAVGSPAAPAFHGNGVLDDGRAWIAMERIAGVNVADLIAEGPLPVRHAIALGLGILDALALVHAARFAHRDLKPDNLVRRTAGSIVILDLGLARKLPTDPDDPTRAGVQVGSLEYIPPEQLLDAATADARADLYAFGCVLYELCAGRPPFIGDAAVLERAHAALRPPPLAALAAVPEELAALCHECLAKQPARRPQTALEVRARLREVGNSPTQHRSQHSMSVISSGKQPVVLLWAELPRVDRALLGMLGARKIVTLSQRGRRVLGAVIGGDHADPAGAAIAAARDLAAAGARVALHLDALAVSRGGPAGGPQVTGAAVDRPEDWLPAGAWTGVVLTRALSTVSQAPTRAAEAGEGFVALAEAGDSTELFGRDAWLADLAGDAAAATGGAGPGLALIVGEPGVGKSALAAALVPRLRELGLRVVAAAVPPPGAGKPGHSALAELIGTPSGPIVRAVGDALRAAARAQPTAIVLDDLHLAEHELLDALEYATLGGEALPLWILGLAAPRLDQRRPGFGQRAERHRRDVLPPLDEDAAVAMTAALLRPAEYPPLRALRQIAGIARGNPLHLASLAREIHDRGAIRVRSTGEHFLDTTALDALPPLALGPWLAERELADLGVELVALARLCAVLGDDIARGELAAVVDAVERAGGATTTIDVDIGLAELESAGILVRSGPQWAFRQSLLEEGVYATTNEDERRTLHAAALGYWRARPQVPAVAARVARHAEAVGERRVAAEAFALLGEHAHAEHRALDADQAWQGALRNLDERDLARGRALLGRARARYRLQRVRDALTDLEEAAAIAVEIADPALEVETLLEQATALDWGDDFEGSAAAAGRARERLSAVGDAPALAVEVELAEARSLWRAQKFDDALPRLRAVKTAARAIGRGDTEILALLLIATVLVDTKQLPAAAHEFDELIPMCEAAGDRFHLGAAYANRGWLWSGLGDTARMVEDLQAVIQIAREIGQAALERIATYNRAEALLWTDVLDEALPQAQRSLSIQRGHGEGAIQWDQLLVARIFAARGERTELAALLPALDAAELAPGDRATVRVLHCAATQAPPDVWAEALAAAFEHLDADHRLELAHLAQRCGRLPPVMAPEIHALAAASPIWSQRPGL